MTKSVKTASSVPGLELPFILATLKAVAGVHQSNHWLTFGSTSYGDHLLFERLYKETDAEIDSIAEKALGVGCPPSFINPIYQAEVVSHIVGEICSGFDPSLDGPEAFVEKSLQAENYFFGKMKGIVAGLKNRDGLTRGVDNLLAGIEDTHEGHIYLLNQRKLGPSNPNSWKA
jgi:hypothetical protein